MRRALAVGFGFAVAAAAVMFACGGDDSTPVGGAGTTSNGTAGSGSGTAGSATGAGGSLSGAGGAFGVDAGFDLDAFAGLLGNYTCADLAACCPTLAADQQSSCTQFVNAKSDPICSGVLTGIKAQGFCK